VSEPLVLVPGTMCDARLFAPQVARFSAERAVHVACVAQHNRIEEMASDLLTSAPQRFALAGHGMGGIVAMEVLRRAPDRVSRVALMDTNPLAETPEMAAAREPQMARVKAGKLEDVMGEEMKPAYLAPGPGRPAVLRTMMDMALSLGPDVFLRQSRALQRRRDQQATLARTRVPALILCGEHDSLCPIQRHEVMAELMPAAGLVVIENAGHLPTLENPDETGDALADWLHR